MKRKEVKNRYTKVWLQYQFTINIRSIASQHKYLHTYMYIYTVEKQKATTCFYSHLVYFYYHFSISQLNFNWMTGMLLKSKLLFKNRTYNYKLQRFNSSIARLLTAIAAHPMMRRRMRIIIKLNYFICCKLLRITSPFNHSSHHQHHHQYHPVIALS